MILETKGYSYNDLTIIPEEISDVESRSQCNPFVSENKLPIFASPMASVVDDANYDTFVNNYITPIIPRNIDIKTRILKMNEQKWVALSLLEFEDLFITNYKDRIDEIGHHYYICVDIANGHMYSLYSKCKKAKDFANTNNYKLIIMTGNIANPETYNWICKYNDDYNFWNNRRGKIIDYIRIGIGGGSGCFIDGTKIKTINGEKNIENINVGDKILTIDGTYQKVLNTIRYKSNELIKINNEILEGVDSI